MKKRQGAEVDAFEKLGVFYLGRRRGESAGTSDELVLYDSSDLTTHAVVMGMTGSGKTGLCLALLEEAGLDRVPAIAIDPKGDVGNLLLTFPGLTGGEFLPWVDDVEAQRQNLSREEFAAREAARWESGLKQWGEDGARIAALREAVELRILTPGSAVGRPVKLLCGYAAPPPAVRQDAEALQERIESAATGLLTLLSLDADPIRSRPHILISRILQEAWGAGRDLDLAGLIRHVQQPPFATVGVLPLDEFIAAADRRELAMSLNQLLASPAFSSWLVGEPLDVRSLLYSESGRPRISILSIAHLGDRERMFFVTALLHEVISWMRGQAGTSSLRAILYMDEIFGYFPPTANPPSKRPMLTLLKQARAYGLGLVLATQNPVDLDYKGLANAGTWFLGRLQTEQDKARVLDGIERAFSESGAPGDRRQIDRVLSNLASRQFLLSNVHDESPLVFETRWAMSYLRGPLTRVQIQRLAAESAPPPASPAEEVGGSGAPGLPGDAPPLLATPAVAAAGEIADAPSDEPPIGLGELPHRYVLPIQSRGEEERLVYRPALLAAARVHYVRAASAVDWWDEVQFAVWPPIEHGESDPWLRGVELHPAVALRDRGEPGAAWEPLPEGLRQGAAYARWARRLRDGPYGQRRLRLWHCPAFKVGSQPGEREGDFRIRLQGLAAERRDQQLARLRAQYEGKYRKLREQIERSDAQIAREQEQLQGSVMDTVVQTGSTLLDSLLGRRRGLRSRIRGATASARAARRTAAQHRDVEQARARRADAARELVELQGAFERQVQSLDAELHGERVALETLEIAPRKSDLAVVFCGLAWFPCGAGPGQALRPLWTASPAAGGPAEGAADASSAV